MTAGGLPRKVSGRPESRGGQAQIRTALGSSQIQGESYRFGDYWKLGAVLVLLYFLVAIFWVPVVWPL